MKNAISYFYNLVASDIHQVKDNYFFIVNEKQYVLTLYNRSYEELTEIYQITNILRMRNLPIHEIILNKDNNILTPLNQKNYLLLKINVNYKEIINLKDLLQFSNYAIIDSGTYHLTREWYQLWTSKVDYFEYQISQFWKKHKLIRESFNYFIGLTETSISLLKNTNIKDNYYLAVSHRRISPEDTLFDLYNPLNFVIDIRVRDFAEYFKRRFFISPVPLEEIKYYLLVSNLTTNEMILFFIRMLFPSFYFDLYEKVMEENFSEKKLVNIIENTKSYEEFLKELYNYLRPITNMPEIEWLLK